MGIISVLASKVEQMFPGVSWGTKYASVDAAVLSREYVQELDGLAITTQPIAVSVGIDVFNLTLADYSNSFQEVQSSLSSRANDLFEALQWNRTLLGTPITFSADALRKFFIGQLALLNESKKLHDSGMVFKLGMSLPDIAAHANIVARGYRAFIWLYQNGYLNQMKTDWDKLKTNKPTQGVGGGPAPWIGVLIFVGVISIVAILGYFITTNSELSRRLAAQRDVCKDFLSRGDPNAPSVCKELLSQPKDSPLNSPQKVVESTVASVTTAATIIGVVYLGTLVLPSVISSLQSAFGKKPSGGAAT